MSSHGSGKPLTHAISKSVSEQQRRTEIRLAIREKIVQGRTDTQITKEIAEDFGIATSTAKRYLNHVYEEINNTIATGHSDRDLHLYLTKQRYLLAYQLAVEKKDLKHMILATQRLAELEGVAPDTGKNPLVGINFNGVPGIPQDYSRVSNRDLLEVVDVEHKRLPPPNDEKVFDVPDELTEAEAARLLANQ